MPKYIDRLTDEQQAAINPHVERWIAVGHSTKPADYDTWEEGARECYRFADLEFPSVVVTTASPLSGSYLTGALSHLHERGETLAEMCPSGSTLLAWQVDETLKFRIVKPGEEEGDVPANVFVARGTVR